MHREAFLTELRARIGDALRVDAPALDSVSRDWSGRQVLPRAVVSAGSEADVIALLALAQQHRVPVVPRGAGTSATGACLPLQDCVVLDLSRMNRILALDRADMIAEVEPGVLTHTLQAAAEDCGLFYPPDPASSDLSTLGGNVATCAGGLRAVRYGVTRDYVLGVRAVLAGGQVLESGGRNLKDVAGYDLTRLLVGSEGTLAVMTRLTLKLIPKPPARCTALASFSEDDGAFHAADRLLAEGLWPRALEVMDAQALRLAAESIGEGVAPQVRSRLLVELDGEAGAVAEAEQRMHRVLQENACEVLRIQSAAEHECVWSSRRSISSAVLRITPAKRSEDLGVPRGQLAAAVAELRALGREHDIGVLVYGHAGDANLHCNFLHDPQQPGSTERLKACVDAAYAAVLRRGGTITGEHGIGLRKRGVLAATADPAALTLMRAIKRAFDPFNILNPGKVLEMEPA